ncbi:MULTISPECIES: MBL fold metallo-hydrolase [Thermomonosporaceae]|uniref:MBL fold metallo-hydrolase n=1 Tax=Thermomonosporaceae TaxID=2012 RepID=UPI00255A8682|nr:MULTISPECIES: MBL fold metallo-hydrolase [Thermomonosporaceae]MDL4774523.1 MBL fold metallo-hydrolase [Actinomadura xylanilytica]
MTGGDRAALTPVLVAVAEVVRSRPGAANLPGTPETLAREQAPFLLRAMLRSRGLRIRAATVLEDTRPAERTRTLAALLLHEDDAVARAAQTTLVPGTVPPRDRAAERAERTIADLKKRLSTAQGRLEYARKDTRDALRLLNDTRAAMTDLEERAGQITEQLGIAERRLQEPRAAASALLRALEQPPVPEDDAAARDPHNLVPAPGHNEHLLASARAAGLPPAEILRILRAVVEPAPRARVTAELELRVTPLGGGTEIGGSCLLIEAGGTRILVDAGLRPGERSLPPPGIGRALDGPLHGVVITHAHNDHCGYVPALTALRPDLRVLATAETVRIMPVMWSDTAKIMRQRTRQAARWGGDVTAAYEPLEVGAAARRCEEIPFGVPRRIGEMTIELFPAGHILGAAGVVVRAGDHRVVITGDISGFRQETVDGHAVPESAREADLLVLETTCCGETHDDRDVRVGDLVRSVQEVCQGGGRVLIPAFALGRAQEVALLMRRHLPDVPVRVDGMAVDLSTVFETVTAGGPRPLTVFGGAVAVADRPTELDTFRTGVVITTSGMLNGGPAVQWASRILPERGSALFISGYQDEESPGAALSRLGKEGGEFTLMDRDREVDVPVRARVESMRLSAHADRRGLLDIADEVGARQVMLVHGLPRRQRRFREVLRVRDHRTAETALWRSP